MKYFAISLFCYASLLLSDIKGTGSQLQFDVNSDGAKEMTLSSVGLGIGTIPASNLHIQGNALINNLNIGGTSGSSNLFIHGTLELGIQSISSNTILRDHSVILANSTSDNLEISLPYAGNVRGRIFKIKKISENNVIWVSGGGNLIDDSDPIELSSGTPLASLEVFSNGSQWYILNSKNIADTIASSNLIGWWKFNESSGNIAYDSSGMGHHGVLHSSMSFSSNSIEGKKGTALAFDGADDYVTLPVGSGEWNSIDNEITLSFWAYGADTLPANRNVFQAQASGSRILGSHLPWSNSIVYWDSGNTTNYDRIQKSASSSDFKGKWSMWTYTKNVTTGSMKLYLNGELWHSGTGKTITIDADNITSFAIGAGASGAGPYPGNIDDFRIYNRELSDAEIKALFTQGN
jgi:hypothetical protein